MWRTCCSRARSFASAISRFARHSAPAARRLFGQVMGETIALGMLGSVVGIGLAWGLLRIFVTLAPVNFPRLAAITLDTGVLGFSLVVAVLAGLVAGLAPAIHLLRSDLNGVIRSGGSRSVTAGRARAASRLLVDVGSRAGARARHHRRV